MAALATIAAVASIGSLIVGTGLSLVSAQKEAEASQKAGEFEQQNQEFLAQQEEASAREDFAATQREAQERKLEGELVLSRQQAAAAASGGGAGADAPTIVRLMTETASRAETGRASVIYGAQSRKDTLFRSAAARRISGRNSFLGGIEGANGAWLKGLGSLAGGIGSIGNAYNQRYGTG